MLILLIFNTDKSGMAGYIIRQEGSYGSFYWPNDGVTEMRIEDTNNPKVFIILFVMDHTLIRTLKHLQCILICLGILAACKAQPGTTDLRFAKIGWTAHIPSEAAFLSAVQVDSFAAATDEKLKNREVGYTSQLGVNTLFVIRYKQYNLFGAEADPFDLDLVSHSTFDKDSGTNYAIIDTVTVFRHFLADLCRCDFDGLKKSQGVDYDPNPCVKKLVAAYTDSFKRIGFDPATEKGLSKLRDVISHVYEGSCPEFDSLLMVRTAEEEAKKLYFKGNLVSQRPLPSGQYEVILQDAASAKVKTFLSPYPVDESIFKQKCKPGYLLVLEYKVVKNKTSGKDEYFLNGSMGTDNCLLK